jgi:hypothetical protein
MSDMEILRQLREEVYNHRQQRDNSRVREAFQCQNFQQGSSDRSGTAHRAPLRVKHDPRKTRTRSFGELNSRRTGGSAESSSRALLNVPFRSSSETSRLTKRNWRSFSRRASSEAHSCDTNPPSLDGAIIHLNLSTLRTFYSLSNFEVRRLPNVNE